MIHHQNSTYFGIGLLKTWNYILSAEYNFSCQNEPLEHNIPFILQYNKHIDKR